MDIRSQNGFLRVSVKLKKEAEQLKEILPNLRYLVLTKRSQGNLSNNHAKYTRTWVMVSVSTLQSGYSVLKFFKNLFISLSSSNFSVSSVIKKPGL